MDAQPCLEITLTALRIERRCKSLIRLAADGALAVVVAAVVGVEVSHGRERVVAEAKADISHFHLPGRGLRKLFKIVEEIHDRWRWNGVVLFRISFHPAAYDDD